MLEPQQRELMLTLADKARFSLLCNLWLQGFANSPVSQVSHLHTGRFEGVPGLRERKFTAEKAVDLHV